MDCTSMNTYVAKASYTRLFDGNQLNSWLFSVLTWMYRYMRCAAIKITTLIPWTKITSEACYTYVINAHSYLYVDDFWNKSDESSQIFSIAINESRYVILAIGAVNNRVLLDLYISYIIGNTQISKHNPWLQRVRDVEWVLILFVR